MLRWLGQRLWSGVVLHATQVATMRAMDVFREGVCCVLAWVDAYSKHRMLSATAAVVQPARTSLQTAVWM